MNELAVVMIIAGENVANIGDFGGDEFADIMSENILVLVAGCYADGVWIIMFKVWCAALLSVSMVGYRKQAE